MDMPHRPVVLKRSPKSLRIAICVGCFLKVEFHADSFVLRLFVFRTRNRSFRMRLSNIM